MTEGTLRRAPMLDGRLSAAMALARGAQVFADIGADHGRLSAVMLLSGGARRALVADVSAAALSRARRRLCALGLESRVTFCVADGLDALAALGDCAADTVFVLGMGGDTVSGILQRGYERLGGAALILGAQSELPAVRAALCGIGYRIRREVVATAGGRDYVLMRCTPALAGEAAYTERERMLGPVLMRERPPAWERVLARREKLLLGALAAMRRAANPKDRERLERFERELDYVAEALRGMRGKAEGNGVS